MTGSAMPENTARMAHFPGPETRHHVHATDIRRGSLEGLEYSSERSLCLRTELEERL